MTEGVQSVSRALDLLECLASTPDELPLKEIGFRTELRPPTAHRLLRTLVDRGWVVQSAQTNRYRLSQKLIGIVGDLEARTARLRALARPHLDAVRVATDETVNLVVLDGLTAVYLDQAASSRPIRMFTAVGARVPAYASGAGKAMLAYAPEGVLATLGETGLKPLTPQTLPDVRALDRELADIRVRGFAFDHDEYELGVSCAAAAVCGEDGHSVAALSVSAPSARWAFLDCEHLGSQLAHHADQLSSELY